MDDRFFYFDYSRLGYIDNEMAEKTLDLFEQMSLSPNNIIYRIIFKACALLADQKAKSIGKKLVDQMSNELSMNTILSNSAIHMLVQFNDIERGEHLFQSIKNKNVVSYACMMQGKHTFYNFHKNKISFRISAK